MSGMYTINEYEILIFIGQKTAHNMPIDELELGDLEVVEELEALSEKEKVSGMYF